jgi:hypothetical protein
MRFRKIFLALLACLALGAIAVSAAQAEGTGWTTAATEAGPGTLIPNGTHLRVKCKRHGTSKLLFTGKLLKAAVELEAEGVDCLEKSGSTNLATLDNTTSPNHSEGVLTFTNVKVLKPENCEVGNASHDLTTSALTDTVRMDKTTGSTAVYDEFFPEVAANGFVKITFSGAKCALAEDSSTVKGNACGEAVHTSGTSFVANKTGELKFVQSLLFGEAQQKTFGCTLEFGGEDAFLDGAVDNELENGFAFGSD